MSTHIRGSERSQVLMLPECVEDYVGVENPARVIEAFVEGLDLAKVGLQASPASTGRPSYDPRDLLKLYIYGYLHRIRSSRELERQTHRNLELIWLMRQLRPDHKTISEFRRRNLSCFKLVLRQFNVLCRELDLFGRELLAIDGTIFKAVNARSRNFTRESLKKMLSKIDEGIEQYLEQAQAADEREAQADPAQGAKPSRLQEKLAWLQQHKAKYEELLERMKPSAATQLSLSDPESRLMKKSTMSGAVVGYNVQSAVDAKHHLIVELEATQAGNDYGQLTAIAVAAKEQLQVEHLEVVADKGYREIEDIERCQQAGISVFVPPVRDRQRTQGLFGRDAFVYDSQKDVCRCPAGQELIRHEDNLDKGKVYQVYYHTAACEGCALRVQCTRGKYRKYKRQKGQEALEAAQARAQARPEVQGRRKGIVEHPFGTLKFWWGQGAFLLKSQEKVNAELQLSALAYNLRRALNVLGVKALRTRWAA